MKINNFIKTLSKIISEKEGANIRIKLIKENDKYDRCENKRKNS